MNKVLLPNTFFSPFSSLGLAYAGSNREDVLSLILPVLGDPKSNLEVSLEFLKNQQPMLLSFAK